MAALQLPLPPGVPRYRFEVELEGTSYGFSGHWNARDGFWYLSLSSGAGEPILSGARVVLNAPLLRKVASPLRPPGEFLAIDTSSRGLPPTRHDFGSRVLLVYLERGPSPLGAR